MTAFAVLAVACALTVTIAFIFYRYGAGERNRSAGGQSPSASAVAVASKPPAVTAAEGVAIIEPTEGQTVTGTVTIKVRVAERDRITMVNFYRYKQGCQTSRADRVFLGTDLDRDNDGVFSYQVPAKDLGTGCRSLSAAGIDKTGSDRKTVPPDGVGVSVQVL